MAIDVVVAGYFIGGLALGMAVGGFIVAVTSKRKRDAKGRYR